MEAQSPLPHGPGDPEAASRRTERARADLAREELETVKRALRAVEAQVFGADRSAVPAHAPAGDYLHTRFAKGGAKPRAWEVRAFGETGPDGQARTVWRVYAPLWCAGRAVLLPAGMGRGWNDLAESAGRLYAALTWTGTLSVDAEGAESVAWAPGTPLLTTNPAALPADAEPAEGAPGSRTVFVELGDFVPAAQGSGTTFEQRHVGVIVEGLQGGAGGGGGLPDGAEAWGKVEVEEETDGSASSGGKTIAYNLYQHKQAWDAAQARFVDKPGSRVLVGSIPAAGDGGGGVPYVPGGPELAEDEDGTLWELAYFCEVALSAEGVPSLVKTEHVAWRRQVAHHADDHTQGVL